MDPPTSSLHLKVLNRPPPLLPSPFFEIRQTPVSGQSIFSTLPIPTGTIIHTSGPPFCSTVLTAYRKACCAGCFKLVPSGNWKIREEGRKAGVRWFCSELCHDAWKAELGVVGVEAAVACEAVIREHAHQRPVAETAFDKGLDKEPLLSLSLSQGAITLPLVLEAWLAASLLGTQIALLRSSPSRPHSKSLRRIEASLTPLTAEDDTDVLRLLVDGISHLYHQSTYPSPPTPTDKPPPHPSWGDLQSLVPTLEFYAHTGSGQEALRSYIRMYQSLLFTLPLPLLAFWTPENVMTILSRDSGNSFGIWEDLGQLKPNAHTLVPPPTPEAEGGPKNPRGPLLAYAIYPSSSYFNHSCAPNISKRWSATAAEWVFTTLREVGEGEELCISYLGGGEEEGRGQRREGLKFGWGFDCGCGKCQEEEGEEVATV